MIQIILEDLSKKYRVVSASEIDFEKIYSLYSSNKSYFDYFEMTPSKEHLLRDMTMLPDGCSKDQKHFLAFFDGDRLTAIMDIISGYPNKQTCYIGLFMVSAELHGRGIGTGIISELCGSLGRFGYEAVRLAYGKHYTAAKSFWNKNGFIPVREAVHEEYGEVVVAERRLNMTVTTNELSAELFLQLYTSVGWEPPGIEQIRTALKNTISTFTAYDNDKAIGMVRLIGDGGMSFYIKDFAVVPEYQSKGVGTVLLNALEGYIRKHISPDWAVSLELISSKEAVGFYRKHGFEERPCDWDGPGMFKMIR